MQEILGHPDAKHLINESNRCKGTPLHVAAMNGYTSVVEVSYNLYIFADEIHDIFRNSLG